MRNFYLSGRSAGFAANGMCAALQAAALALIAASTAARFQQVTVARALGEMGH